MKIKWWQIALLLSLLLVALSPLASSAPDGLERVAEDKGFIGLAEESPFQIMADYLLPGIENEVIATILAGLIGTLVVFGGVYGLAWLLRSGKKRVT